MRLESFFERIYSVIFCIISVEQLNIEALLIGEISLSFVIKKRDQYNNDKWRSDELTSSRSAKERPSSAQTIGERTEEDEEDFVTMSGILNS